MLNVAFMTFPRLAYHMEIMYQFLAIRGFIQSDLLEK